MHDKPAAEQPEPNSYDDFCGRFDELRHEADTYGIDSLVVLREHNSLAVSPTADTPYLRRRGTECVSCAYGSGLVLAIVMASYALHLLRTELFMEDND